MTSRIEVAARVSGRRYWTVGQKLGMLRDAFGSGGSVRTAIERHEISSGLLHTWRKQVAPSTAVRWRDQQRRTGGYAPKPQGGDQRSGRIEAHQALVLALYEQQRDITLDELRQGLPIQPRRQFGAGGGDLQDCKIALKNDPMKDCLK